MNQNFPRKLFIWMLTVIFIVGTPTLLVFFSVQRHYLLIEEEKKQKMKILLQQMSNEASFAYDQELFWCRHIYDQFYEFKRNGTDPASISTWLHDQKRLFPDDFDFIIWDKTGKKLSASFVSEHDDRQWQNLISVIASFKIGFPPSDFGIARPSLEEARKLAGPQLMPHMFRGLDNPAAFSFCWPDSSRARPPIGAHFTGSAGILFLFNYRLLETRSGLKYTLKKFSSANGVNSGLLESMKSNDPEVWQSSPDNSADEVAQAVKFCRKNNSSFFINDAFYLGTKYLGPGLHGFVVVPRKFSNSGILGRSIAASAAFIVFMLPFFIYTWKSMVRYEPVSLSIRFKLAFLFLFASGIPLLALTIISQEHYSHKKRALMAEVHQSSIDMLFSIDNRYFSFLDMISNRMDRFFDDWGSRVGKEPFSFSMLELVNDNLKDLEFQNFYVVPSHTRVIGHSTGFYPYRGEFDSPVFDFSSAITNRERPRTIKDDLFAANLICKKVMGDLNRVQFSGNTLSKLEIVAESILQKSFIEITNSIIANLGRINSWGFGEMKDLTYFRFISVFDKTLTDYAAMVFWKPMTLQRLYLRRALEAANRNGQGFRVYAYDQILGDFLPAHPEFVASLKEFSARLGNKPTEEIEIININGQDYMAAGFCAQHLNYFKILQLYPMNNIEYRIGLHRHGLFFLILLCLLLAAGLAQILTQSFVRPLKLLGEGALAIESRNFAHRVNYLSRDEFGEVGEIFNEIMVDLEELKVARIVQEGLFPAPDFSQGNLSVYGKSVCMSELGGDYLDFFEVDKGHFALLIGDVAGHGVGAAVIMAMAKAGILGLKSLVEKPSALLLALHQLILASKGKKQRKVMTFQYLFFDSESCKGSYSNAGGCSPYILRKNGRQIDELKLSGAALGAFKKATYAEQIVELQPGDAIVFYTDGIVESRDEDGNEIGYDGFKRLLLQSYDCDPKTFYDNIFRFYQSHIKTTEAQDDLTMIVMVRPPENKFA